NHDDFYLKYKKNFFVWPLDLLLDTLLLFYKHDDKIHHSKLFGERIEHVFYQEVHAAMVFVESGLAVSHLPPSIAVHQIKAKLSGAYLPLLLSFLYISCAYVVVFLKCLVDSFDPM